MGGEGSRCGRPPIKGRGTLGRTADSEDTRHGAVVWVQAVSCLASTQCYHGAMNAKQRRTLAAIFTRPTLPTVVFSDIEALIKALGGSVQEREGSRVKLVLCGHEWRCHRPHPGKGAKRYQVEEVRDLLERAGVMP